MTEDLISPRAVPGELGGIHTVTGLEHNEAGRPKDTPEIHEAMTEKRHRKLAPAIHHPDLTTWKRFGDEGKVDVGVIAWGSTFGEALEAMLKARAEGIRCAAMKVVMLSPLPEDAIRRFCADCAEVLVPELNYQGQFANLLTGATGCRVNRLTKHRAGRCRSRTSWPRSGVWRRSRRRAALRRRLNPQRTRPMAELREPIYLEEKLKEIQGTGRLDYRSKALPTWCPGCGYFSMTEGVASAFNRLGIAKKDVVIVSGIGCASRFPFFMDTYGFHTLHGRTLPVATGIKLANDKLTVIAIGGDGDGFAIGAGHIPHAARRNVDITYLLVRQRHLRPHQGPGLADLGDGLQDQDQPVREPRRAAQPLDDALVLRRQLGRPGLCRADARSRRHDRRGARAPRLLLPAHPLALRDLRQDQHDLPEPRHGGARPAGEPRPYRPDGGHGAGDGHVQARRSACSTTSRARRSATR